MSFQLVYLFSDSLDKITVEVEGQTYPLKKVAQLGMPNPQTIHVNMSAYPEVSYYYYYDDDFVSAIS